jgi:uncharacterized protein (TIGR04222 family)
VPLNAQSKSYSAERFDVDWNLLEGGTLEVTETVVFRFEGGPFTFVYRELPDDYSDGVEVISASLDGQPLPQGSEAGQVEIKGDSPIVVTWHLPPTTDATHTFELKYRVLGVVRQEEGADVFWWNALPTEYEYPIASTTVRLTYPPNVEPSGPPEVRQGNAQITQANGQVTWTAQNVEPDTPLTVAVPFPAGSLISAPPAWQARAASIQAAMPGFLVAAGAALAAGLAALGALWARARRPETAVPSAVSRTSILPGNLPPALAGTLVGTNGQPGATHALGTLFDLGQRGMLTIEESPDKRWYKGREFDIRQLDRASHGLRPHEQGLLTLAFTDKRGPADTVKMSELGQRLSSRFKEFSEPLTEELNAAGLIDPRRKATAQRFMVLGVVLLLMMLPLGALSLLFVDQYGGWPFLFAGVALVLSIVTFIMGAAYSHLSDEGARAAARWRGFQEYLKDVTKGRESAWDINLFERYLPYAAAFGLAEGWAKAFQKRGGAEIPVWFRAVAEGDDGNIAAFIVMTSAAHSSGASAAGGAGGGGAGGGGGSGAG